MGQRFLRQRLPWIAIEEVDLRPQGDPETVVFLRQRGSLLGLNIRGLPDHVMLGIRENERGELIGCAITNELRIDTYDVHSNPRRHDDEPRDYGEQ